MGNGMTPAEIVKALRHCATVDGSGCYECPAKSEFDCEVLMKTEAADLIERLEKEKAALMEIAKARPICATCKHHIGCKAVELADCRRCIRRKDCVCVQCVGWTKWEWKGLVENK